MAFLLLLQPATLVGHLSLHLGHYERALFIRCTLIFISAARPCGCVPCGGWSVNLRLARTSTRTQCTFIIGCILRESANRNRGHRQTTHFVVHTYCILDVIHLKSRFDASLSLSSSGFGSVFMAHRAIRPI